MRTLRSRSVQLAALALVGLSVQAVSDPAVSAPAVSAPAVSAPAVSARSASPATGAVAGPAFPARTSLSGVLALADDDVWVVGSTTAGSDTSAFVRRWDGAAWSSPACPVGSPAPDTRTFFDLVAGSSPNDVWLAGARSVDQQDRTYDTAFFVHWDGATCARVPAPSPNHDFYLTDIEAFAPDDVVVSGVIDRSHDGFETRPLLLRWDGRGWSRIPGPSAGGADRGNRLLDIAGTSSDDLWASVAVPDFSQSEDGRIFHLVGGTWSAVDPVANDDYEPVLASAGPSRVFAAGYEQGVFSARLWRPAPGWRTVPAPSSSVSFVNDIDVGDAADAWAVGEDAGPGSRFNSPRALHWTGSSWALADPPTPAETWLGLNDVSVAPTEQAWAVGYVVADDSTVSAYVLRWANGVWTRRI